MDNKQRKRKKLKRKEFLHMSLRTQKFEGSLIQNEWLIVNVICWTFILTVSWISFNASFS